jgi:hypothetical protein
MDSSRSTLVQSIQPIVENLYGSGWRKRSIVLRASSPASCALAMCSTPHSSIMRGTSAGFWAHILSKFEIVWAARFYWTHHRIKMKIL